MKPGYLISLGRMWLGRLQNIVFFVCLIAFVRLGDASDTSSSEDSTEIKSPCKRAYGYFEEITELPEGVIGVGGNSQVFSALYKGERVALKEIRLEGFTYEALQMTYSRIWTYKLLGEHDNIAAFKECYEVRGAILIAMEYVNGRNLGEFGDYVFENSEINRIMYSVMAGLHKLHSNKIMHRDIKDENIMISEDGQVKLVDFDLIHDIEEEGLPINYAGTPHYMAPEVLKKSMDRECEEPYGLPADIWSCGILLYRLIVGRVPKTLEFPEFGDSLPSSWFTKVLSYYNVNSIHDGSMWIIGGDSDWDEVLKSMITWDPNNRKAAGDLFIHFYLPEDVDEAARQDLVITYNNLFYSN